MNDGWISFGCFCNSWEKLLETQSIDAQWRRIWEGDDSKHHSEIWVSTELHTVRLVISAQWYWQKHYRGWFVFSIIRMRIQQQKKIYKIRCTSSYMEIYIPMIPMFLPYTVYKDGLQWQLPKSENIRIAPWWPPPESYVEKQMSHHLSIVRSNGTKGCNDHSGFPFA